MDLGGGGEEMFMNMNFQQGQRMTHHIFLIKKVFPIVKTADVNRPEVIINFF